MREAIALGAVCMAACAGGMEVPPELQGANAWGGRERHPAVVNSVLAEPSADVLSLSGTWEFGVRERNAPGLFFKSMIPKDLRPIHVPGCWESQGVGEEGMSGSYVCRDNSPKPMRHVYEGVGIYRKCVDIPAGWAGKRIWIKTGYIWSQGWIRVNDKPVAWVSTYCGTYKWEITDLVNPGEKAEIVIVADNLMPNRAGAHYGSGRFGGIVRDIELEATPDTFIDDAWVRGLFDEKAAEVKVTVCANETGTTGVSPVAAREDTRPPDAAVSSKPPYQIRVTIDDQIIEQPLKSFKPLKPLKLPLRNFRPWSPEHPNLYTAKVELVAADGRVLQVRKERFGVRKFEIRGKDIYLNGRPFFFRGFGDNHSFPITGAMPADREAFRSLLGRARAAGFNYVRTHTYCPFPEYFEAADELGIIVQPELPYYGNATEDGAEFDPLRDIDERWRHFRRHVSWGVASQGNEGQFCDRLKAFMYRYQKDLDPDRLVTAQDGAGSFPPSSGEPYTDFHRGARMEWERGSYNAFPFVCHEYLNLTVKSDAGIAADYAGLWLPPETPERRAAFLEKAGLSATGWSDRLQLAQHGAQAFWMKYGLEQARLDPYCDGYCYWTIADTTVFNPVVGVFSAQGVWDPFWRRKRGSIDAADIAVFNSPTALLMLNRDELPEKPYPVPSDQVTDPAHVSYGYWKNQVAWPGLCRVYRSGDTIPLEIYLAQYGERPLPAARLMWKLTTTDGQVLASSSAETSAQPIGPERRLAEMPVVVPALKTPVKAIFSAALEGTDVPPNAWMFWLFPEREHMTVKGLYVSKSFPQIASRYDGLADDLGSATTVLAPYGSTEAQKALAAGKNLVTLANVDTPLNVRLGWWDIGRQCGTAIRESPLLAGFPQESQLTPLLMRIFRVGTEMPVAPFGSGDAVIVCEGGTECRLYLAERRLPSGARYVFMSGLDVVSDTTEGVHLLDSILGVIDR